VSELRALVVTPLSGPPAGFGRTTAAALRLWADQAVEISCPSAASGRGGITAPPSLGA